MMTRFLITVSRRAVPLLAGLLWVFWLTGCPPQESGTEDKKEPVAVQTQPALRLQFGVYTSDKPSAMVDKFRPVLNLLETSLSQDLGRPVKIAMAVSQNYDEGLRDLVSGKVDFSRLGPASYVEAKKQNPRIRLLAMETKNGVKQFNGIICVHQDSAIRQVTQLKGKSFAFGDERSTIGRYLSQQYLFRNGVRARDLKNYDYLGRHDLVGSAVGLGRYEAGALKEGTFDKLVSQGQPLRKMANFPNVTKPWVARGDLPATLQTALRKALLSLRDAGALKVLGSSPLVEADESDFVFVREAIEENGRFFE